jgi:hypothetical protein
MLARRWTYHYNYSPPLTWRTRRAFKSEIIEVHPPLLSLAAPVSSRVAFVQICRGAEGHRFDAL